MTNSYKELIQSYEATKKDLKETENSIRRLTGRDPDEAMAVVPGPTKRRGSSIQTRSYSNRSTRGSSYAMGSRWQSQDNEVITIKSNSSSSDDYSSDESPSRKPVLQSTVVFKKNQKISRSATIQKQNINPKIKDRNRRMFGSVVKTLESFRNEEIKRQSQTSMRSKIEKKVDAATEEEKEKIRKEKDALFTKRLDMKSELRCLEKKMELAKDFEIFKENQEKLFNFVCTKTKPPIYFLPASHNAETRKALEESRSKLQDVMKKKKEAFEKDLNEIDNWYKKSSTVPNNKENKLPSENSVSQDIPEIQMEEQEQDDEDVRSSSKMSESSSEDENNINVKNLSCLGDNDFEPIYD